MVFSNFGPIFRVAYLKYGPRHSPMHFFLDGSVESVFSVSMLTRDVRRVHDGDDDHGVHGVLYDWDVHGVLDACHVHDSSDACDVHYICF
jgi:hypothetical protein